MRERGIRSARPRRPIFCASALGRRDDGGGACGEQRQRKVKNRCDQNVNRSPERPRSGRTGIARASQMNIRLAPCDTNSTAGSKTRVPPCCARNKKMRAAHDIGGNCTARTLREGKVIRGKNHSSPYSRCANMNKKMGPGDGGSALQPPRTPPMEQPHCPCK